MDLPFFKENLLELEHLGYIHFIFRPMTHLKR